jgi:RNA-directed DNA polymerase
MPKPSWVRKLNANSRSHMETHECRSNLTEWKNIDWIKAQKDLSRIQHRIYKASLNGNKILVQKLQRRLLSSFYARALAVRMVTEKNQGKKTPGVDHVIVVKGTEKLQMARNLTLNGKASSIRRIFIPKPGSKKQRPLGIPTIRDRAKQKLVHFALDASWEAKFEPNSYGFRPGRSCQDAIGAIFQTCRGSQKWVLDVDIHRCFEKINHEKLIKKLDTFPLIENQVNAWLKAGVMQCKGNHESETSQSDMGTPQGGIISPLLANIALHGMEEGIKNHYVEKYRKNFPGWGKRDILRKVAVIRYADDFVIISDIKLELEEIKQYLEKWLMEEAGLEVSSEKTHILNSAEGFDFLGFHMISVNYQNRWKFLTKVSRKSKANHIKQLRNIVQKYKGGSSAQLIMKLNPVIRGWCNYYRTCQSTDDFNQMEYMLFGQIRAWVFRRKSKGLRSRTSIKLKYFPEKYTIKFDGVEHSSDWILVGQKVSRRGVKENIHLIRHSWVLVRNHVKVQGDASPYNGDHIYWATRSVKYGVFNLTEQKLLKKQSFKCNICKKYLETGQIIERDHIIRIADGGKDIFTNLQMVHRYCHQIKTNLERSKIKGLTKKSSVTVDKD